MLYGIMRVQISGREYAEVNPAIVRTMKVSEEETKQNRMEREFSHAVLMLGFAETRHAMLFTYRESFQPTPHTPHAADVGGMDPG